MADTRTDNGQDRQGAFDVADAVAAFRDDTPLALQAARELARLGLSRTAAINMGVGLYTTPGRLIPYVVLPTKLLSGLEGPPYFRRLGDDPAFCGESNDPPKVFWNGGRYDIAGWDRERPTIITPSVIAKIVFDVAGYPVIALPDERSAIPDEIIEACHATGSAVVLAWPNNRKVGDKHVAARVKQLTDMAGAFLATVSVLQLPNGCRSAIDWRQLVGAEFPSMLAAALVERSDGHTCPLVEVSPKGEWVPKVMPSLRDAREKVKADVAAAKNWVPAGEAPQIAATPEVPPSTEPITELLHQITGSQPRGEQWVFLTEAQADVDILTAEGFEATCVPAGRWRPDYAAPYRDRLIAILADDSDRIARSLHAAGALGIKIIDVPEYDVAAWLTSHERAARYGLVRDLIARTPAWRSQRKVPLGWPILDERALYGLAGEVVRTLDPHTEADRVAVLVQFLAAFGCMVGAGPHARVGAAEHPARLSIVIVGQTAKARKGTSWTDVEHILTEAEPSFFPKHLVNGFASGEAVISAVRDASEDGTEPGVTDKRALIQEGEFGKVLKVNNREGSIYSNILRDTWDGRRLQNRVKLATMTATDHHVSVVGHITLEELVRDLQKTDVANGFANRFLFVLVTRSKLLPAGGKLSPDEITGLAHKIRGRVDDARKLGKKRLDRTSEAEDRWCGLYHELAESDATGGYGAVIARAEAQVLRLSVVYALLDGSRTIELDHLEAAAALWQYCDDSARYIFGAQTDEERDLGKLLDAYRKAGSKGLDTTKEYAVFNKHVKAAQLDRLRETLTERGLVRVETVPTNGRARQITYACEPANLRIKPFRTRDGHPDSLDSPFASTSNGSTSTEGSDDDAAALPPDPPRCVTESAGNGLSPPEAESYAAEV